MLAFRTTTTLRQLTKPTRTDQTLEHEKSGVYKLSCKTCQKSYIGQTSRNLKSRFREHTRYTKNNDPHSTYALHILNCRHEYGNINDTVTLLKRIDSPISLLLTGVLCSHLQTATIPDAVRIQFVLLKMDMLMLEACRG